MKERIVVILICVFVLTGAAYLAYAVEDNIAEDNFLTNAITSVIDKVNKVTSGEEPILIKDYNKSDEPEQDYTTDALGRKVKAPTIRSTGGIPLSKDEKAAAAADEKKAVLPAAGTADDAE